MSKGAGLGGTDRQRCMLQGIVVVGTLARAGGREVVSVVDDMEVDMAWGEGCTHVDLLTSGARERSAVLEVDEQSGVRSVPSRVRQAGASMLAKDIPASSS